MVQKKAYVPIWARTKGFGFEPGQGFEILSLLLP